MQPLVPANAEFMHQTAEEVTRRTLLATGLVAAGALLLGACGDKSPSQPRADVTPNPELPAPAAPNLHPGLATSTDSQLRLIGEYEKTLGSMPEVMRFITMPNSVEVAADMAAGVAAQIKVCATAEIAPRFIMEPADIDLQHLDVYALDTYFKTLKARGITDAQMGTWVPLPEPSLPELWEGGTNPKLFVKNFNAVSGLIKKYFPKAAVCMMLDSSTFPDGDWGSRTYQAGPLLAYATDIKPGLVDEFGLQGFPRVSGSTDPHTLVNNVVALQASARLGAHKIWVNTGTYRQERDANPDTGHKLVQATLQQRQAFLDGIVKEVTAMRAAGRKVSVTLFSENKFGQTEGVDWGYNPGELTSTVKPFAERLASVGAGFSIFDQPR